MKSLSELLKLIIVILSKFQILIRKCNLIGRKTLDTVTLSQFILHGPAEISKNVEVEQNILLFLANAGSEV